MDIRSFFMPKTKTKTYACRTCEFTSPTWGMFTRGLCFDCWEDWISAQFKAEHHGRK